MAEFRQPDSGQIHPNHEVDDGWGERGMFAKGERNVVLYGKRIEQCGTLERYPNGTSYPSQFRLREVGDVDSFHEHGKGMNAFKPENLAQKRALSRPAPS